MKDRIPLLALLLLLFTVTLLALLLGPAALRAAPPARPVARQEVTPTTTITLTGLSNGPVISRYVVTNTAAFTAQLTYSYYNTGDSLVWSTTDSLAPQAAYRANLAEAGGLPANYQGYAVLTATQPITAHLLPPIYRVQQVAVTGPAILSPTLPGTFTAAALPLSTTLPLTFTWDTPGSLPLTHTDRGLTDTAVFSWTSAGIHPLTVTISHRWSQATTVYLVQVAPGGNFHVWLPLLATHPQNLPPNLPTAPLPAPGSTGVALFPLLQWSGGDPDGQAVSYDVYLKAGSGPPARLACENVPEPQCAPGRLEVETTYTWQIVAQDSAGVETAGPLWSFTTRSSDFEAAVVDLVNRERAVEGGCGPLTADSRLIAAARGHSQDMADNDFFSHTGSNDSTFVSRALAQGYDYWALGENIAAGYQTPEAVVEGWMNSPGHRANIFNCDFSDIGVGYVYHDPDPGEVRYRHYWTQMFGKPR